MNYKPFDHDREPDVPARLHAMIHHHAQQVDTGELTLNTGTDYEEPWFVADPAESFDEPVSSSAEASARHARQRVIHGESTMTRPKYT